MAINKDLIASIDFAYSKSKELLNSPAGELEAEQLLALRDLVRHARKLKFWKERLSSLPEDFDLTDFAAEVPVLTRSEIQEAGGLLRLRIPNTQNRDYFTTRTSGSTGKPVEVMKFKPSQLIQSSVTTLIRKDWAKLDTSLNYARVRTSRDEETFDSWGFPYTLLGESGKNYTLDIKLRGPSGILEILAEREISYLHANTTMLRVLALQHLNEEPRQEIQLKLLLTWAEKVTNEDRDFLREAFGIGVWDTYSSEELGAIAIQCEHDNHLHSLPFFNHVEIVDEIGAPCKIGQLGRIVVTSIHNFAQPLIRYELGDLASFGEPCDRYPTLPVINPEVTRIRDSYISQSGNKIFPRFGKSRFLKYRGMGDYQIILLRDAVLFLYSAARELTSTQIREVEEDIGKQFDFDLPVTCFRAPSGSLSNEWKRKVFYRANAYLPDKSHLESELSRLLEMSV